MEIVAFSALFLLGIGCGARLLTHWRKYRHAGKHHRRWQIIWAAGWALVLVAVVTLLLPATRTVLPFVVFLAPLLWLIAYIEFRKARAQEPSPPFLYDAPQEGVRPPSPTNPPQA